MYAQQTEWRCIKCGSGAYQNHLPGCPILITNVREEKAIRFVVGVVMIGLVIGIGSILLWIMVQGG